MAGRSSRSRSSSGLKSGNASSYRNPTSRNVQPTVSTPSPVTVAAPIQQHGFFSGIVQAAVGTTIGHTVGRAVTNMMGLNSSGYSAPTTSMPPESTSVQSTQNKLALCEPHFKSFITCMDKNNQDTSACQYYLDMLKSCREGTSEATTSW